MRTHHRHTRLNPLRIKGVMTDAYARNVGDRIKLTAGELADLKRTTII
jgi:hypothetical protein